jgi:hypothetical protein
MSATRRVADLFERNQGVPISRSQIRKVANQLDYMKRIRRNGGARDLLDQKRIAILWGSGDATLISRLKLGLIAKTEFISYAPKNAQELALIRAHGHPLV